MIWQTNLRKIRESIFDGYIFFYFFLNQFKKLQYNKKNAQFRANSHVMNRYIFMNVSVFLSICDDVFIGTGEFFLGWDLKNPSNVYNKALSITEECTENGC